MDHHDIKNFNFLKPYIEKGDVLIDVGANYGDYTKFFLDTLDGTGKVYSFELDPKTASVLKNRFKDHSNAFIYNKAVYNEDSQIDFYKGRDEWTNNIIGHDMQFNSNPIAGKVDSIRLDTFLAEEKSIKILKIDVEGAEKYVLEGIEKIINRIKFLLVECHLDNDWEYLRHMLLEKYQLTCMNIETMKKVTIESGLPYQCFCINKNIL